MNSDNEIMQPFVCPECGRVYQLAYPPEVLAVIEAAKRYVQYPPVEYEEEYATFSRLHDDLKIAVRALEESEAGQD